MTFNPKSYVKTAEEMWQSKVAFDQFLKENEHLAMPFHVDGLEEIIPTQYPGEVAVYEARSHHGKSVAMKDMLFKAQKRIEGKPGFVVGAVILEDTAENTAGQQVAKYEGRDLDFRDDQFIHIGFSFDMPLDQMADLHMTNILTSLKYGLDRFGDNMRYSVIGIDHFQIIPADPERRKMNNLDQKRLQVADDVSRVVKAAKYFKCPIVVASQALMKTQRANYSSKMLIPGDADLAEAGQIYTDPDIVYSYWFPKRDYPMGTRIEDGNWNFEVTPDLCFIRVVKRRYAEYRGYVGKRAIVGRIFPVKITEVGNFYYDPDYHKRIYLPPLEAK